MSSPKPKIRWWGREEETRFVISGQERFATYSLQLDVAINKEDWENTVHQVNFLRVVLAGMLKRFEICSPT